MQRNVFSRAAMASTALVLGAVPGFASAQIDSTPPATAAVGVDARLDALGRQMEAISAELARLRAENATLRTRLDSVTGPATPPAPVAVAAPAPVPETPPIGTPDAAGPVVATKAPPVLIPATTATTGAVPATPSASTPPVSVVATTPTEVNRPEIFGYGEIAYNNYPHDGARDEADLRRAVIGVGYRFDEDTRFVSEFEIEHAVTSASDAGEFEVEQFYIDHRLSDNVHAKGGLLLLPIGYLNVVHEPPRYFGVERNFVETAIIPSTEREGGAALYGTTSTGLAWDAGITTGFNLAKWDFASDEGRASPFGSVHQELSFARAADPAYYGALNYNGTPGYNAGASVFTGKGGQHQPNFPADPRFTLWEAHTRWTPGRFDLSALFAQGQISDTAQVNLLNVGQPTPIPARFYGWYLQAAYRAYEWNNHSIVPFARYERFDTGARYAALPPGLAILQPRGQGLQTVGTFGASFYLNPNIVVKADYQVFAHAKDSDRVNLGLGFMF